MKPVMDQKTMALALEAMACEIIEKYQSNEVDLALVGIRDRGEILAERLYNIISPKIGKPLELGTLDITMYRDDINLAGSQNLHLGSTEIPFSIDGKTVILVDDVLNTGRSIRAALDALVALGRPKAIRLAVLIDRGAREFPIRADHVGLLREDIAENKKVQVQLKECDEMDIVEIVEKE